MNFFKKIMPTCLAVVMALSLCACTEQPSSPETLPATTQTTEQTALSSEFVTDNTAPIETTECTEPAEPDLHSVNPDGINEIVAENDKVKITYLDAAYDDFFNDYVIRLEVENKTENDIGLSAGKILVDEINMGDYCSGSVPAGKKSVIDAYINCDCFEIAGIKEFNSVTFMLNVYNDGDLQDSQEIDPFTVVVNKDAKAIDLQYTEVYNADGLIVGYIGVDHDVPFREDWFYFETTNEYQYSIADFSSKSVSIGDYACNSAWIAMELEKGEKGITSLYIPDSDLEKIGIEDISVETLYLKVAVTNEEWDQVAEFEYVK